MNARPKKLQFLVGPLSEEKLLTDDEAVYALAIVKGDFPLLRPAGPFNKICGETQSCCAEVKPGSAIFIK